METSQESPEGSTPAWFGVAMPISLNKRLVSRLGKIEDRSDSIGERIGKLEQDVVVLNNIVTLLVNADKELTLRIGSHTFFDWKCLHA
jgi:hypothetical protein